MNTWYAPFKVVGKNGKNKSDNNAGGSTSAEGGPQAKKKKSAHPGLGWKKNQTLPSGPPSQICGPVQWTPEGWIAKDNSHKVTSTMKPLPPLALVPPKSVTYPDAAADRDVGNGGKPDGCSIGTSGPRGRSGQDDQDE